MKPAPVLKLLWIVSLLAASSASATTRYVDANGTNATAPYTSWLTAATNIQDAVNLAQTSDLILVTNGIYSNGGRTFSGSSNRVAIDSKILTIQSVNGPAVTIIKGFQVPGTTNGANAARCVYLTSGSMLSGFTLTNGATANFEYGGGVKCQSTTAIVSNCVLTGNFAYDGGGGAYSGTLVNCTLTHNSAPMSSISTGGGASGSTLINCLLTYNYSGYYGGGAFGGTLINCTVVTNATGAGTAGGTDGTTIKNSIVYYNSPDNIAGGNVTNCCTTPVPAFNAVNTITNPPLFANLSGGDFHLQPASACINAGNNSFITNSVDLDGNPRIIAGTVDIGAFEFRSLIHYVALSNSAVPSSPYTNWLTAATNIQDAIDVAGVGDLVLVSNGTYRVGGRAVYGLATNRITLDKAITVQSVNGPSSTAVEGDKSGIRCAYLTNGAALAGFTLTNGISKSIGTVTNEQSGGGIWCESIAVNVSNCVLRNCSANQRGGGAYQGTLDNCSISNNSAFISGGGAYAAILNNCIISGNHVIQGIGGGGAAFGTLNNCIVLNNSGVAGGGAYASTANSCTFSNNTANVGGGGAFFGTLNNCLISSNFVNGSGGGVYSNIVNNCILINNRTPEFGGGAFRSTLNNCTVVSNTASSGGGGYQSTFNNSILFYNVATTAGANYYPANLLNYCCTTPPPTNGIGNITNEPVFVGVTNANFHLQTNSPCINAANNSYLTNTTDFDGNPRIVGNTVDIGAFEFQSAGSALSYAWAQQFGLPTDGSADFADADGDGLNNWQEWRAGTVPTDASSLLQLGTPTVDTTAATITWQSVTNVTYYVQRTASFTTPFSTIQSNIIGHAGTTSYTDTNTADSALFFYRVGVQ